VNEQRTKMGAVPGFLVLDLEGVDPNIIKGPLNLLVNVILITFIPLSHNGNSCSTKTKNEKMKRISLHLIKTMK